MKSYFAGSYDVAVIGAGHAGIEAALAAARLGAATVMFTINLDWIGNMPCNPSIGGTAKGHLVREVDALGGEMGRAADANMLQSRMLNRGKGPAVHSLRAQVDRRRYSEYMKHAVERQAGLDVKQAEIVDLRREGGFWALITRLGAEFHAKSVVLATGTFLKSRIFIGEVNYEGGPDGVFAATELSAALSRLGVPLRRFKTGTPARVHRASIDFSNLEVQKGDDNPVPFSYSSPPPEGNRVVCHIAYTNQKTREIILNNLDRSPLYSGTIHGVGPRYCPSIEDKIVRFADKERHQLFIEPCGEHTEEMYLQGLSSSLPEEVQLALYRSISGLEHVKIMRSAYAIEYDCTDPLALDHSLEFRDLPGLFGAGQFNGSSGYEEAAAQGIVAGINAARFSQSLPLAAFDRAESYIGTLIDDLVTKGCREPYRMMTSRSEYRLLLRQDNADERLTPKGRELGLVRDAEWQRFLLRKSQKSDEIERLCKTTVSPGREINDYLLSAGTSALSTGAFLSDLLLRPQVDYKSLAPFDPDRPALPDDVCEKVEIDLKYRGYIEKQRARVEEAARLENMPLPEDIDYSAVTGLRLEAVEKLSRVRPETIGQAARISGVSPADISVLIVFVKRGVKND